MSNFQYNFGDTKKLSNRHDLSANIASSWNSKLQHSGVSASLLQIVENLKNIPLCKADDEAEGWSLVCSTEAEWLALAETFRKAKRKAETELYTVLQAGYC